jgi:hypothetical protein
VISLPTLTCRNVLRSLRDLQEATEGRPALHVALIYTASRRRSYDAYNRCGSEAMRRQGSAVRWRRRPVKSKHLAIDFGPFPITSLNLVPAERRGWLLLGEFLLFEFEPGIDLGVA